MEHILEPVLKKIKPSQHEEERVKKFASQILHTSKVISGLDAAIVGSIGKFTWLSGDHDVDVFIIFPKSTTREELEKKGLEYGKRIVEELGGKWRIKYAEHPYTHAVISGFDVDIVPCYRIQKGEHIISAVDRSPLHLQYVLDHMSPRMQDEARLLKQFCKAANVYGSDAKNLGFSGYICELLIIYYQTFAAVMRAASVWSAPHVVDIIGSADKTKFRDQPLIIVDPVDKERNAAAVVSADNFLRFMTAARQFIAKPNGTFFTIKPTTPLSASQMKYLQNRGTQFIAVSFNRPDVIDDVLYPQLRRALARMEGLLHHNEFSALRAYEFAGRRCYLIFELEVFNLPPVNNQEGPPVFSKQHSAEFINKYKGKNFLYVCDNKWIAEVKRPVRTADALLESFMRREKQKLVEDGIPSYIAEAAHGIRMLVGKKFFAAVKADKPLSDFLREKYFVDLGKLL